MTIILNKKEIQKSISISNESLKAIEEAFGLLSKGEAIMPPIMRLDIVDKHGEVDVKTAYIKGLESFAIKISPGFFNNPKIGLPTTSGMMVLLNSNTGMLEAVLLDKGYLTDLRTALAGAIASKYLAKKNISNVGIIGAGLAGSEAAWHLAEQGIGVDLYEMRPKKMTEAHRSSSCAELVCSNSFKSLNLENAHGLLKEELRLQKSLILKSAERFSLPAGQALAVDREPFSAHISSSLENHSLITIKREEIEDFLNSLGLDYNLKSAGLNENEFKSTLKTLNNFTIKGGYYYSIVNELEPTESLINDLIKLAK